MLNGISFIGIDERTDLNRIIELAKSTIIPIELGFLYSETKKDNRYPNKEEINRMNNFLTSSGIYDTSLHLCGSVIRKFLSLDKEIIDFCLQFNRIQLNIPMSDYSMDELLSMFNNVCNYFDELEKPKNGKRIIAPIIVLQYNNSKKELIDTFIEKYPNTRKYRFDLLFDNSGGNGKVLENPLAPISGFYCGYAGGIGPDTVQEIVTKINSICGRTPYYIDMESKIRTDNWLDINKCEEVLINLNLFE